MESRVLDDGRGEPYLLVLLSRRSRLHPGTRYIARGLNSLASPGNEIECEQVWILHCLFLKQHTLRANCDCLSGSMS